MIASEGLPVSSEIANAAPIIDVAAPALGPKLNYEPIEGLPPELQPAPGDVLLGKAFWPWADLGAQGIPENWLYMSRHVQGVIAQLAVQTGAGPKLVRAANDGTVIANMSALDPNGNAKVLKANFDGDLLVAEDRRTLSATYDQVCTNAAPVNLVSALGSTIRCIAWHIHVMTAVPNGSYVLQGTAPQPIARTPSDVAGASDHILAKTALTIGDNLQIITGLGGGSRIVGEVIYEIV